MTACKKPARNRYSDLISDDTYEDSSQVSVHSESAFQTGIHFEARFIGSMEVPKPTNRTDIVIAMRRIRFEYKASSVKKRPIKVIVSVSGIKVTYKLPRKIMKFAKQANVTEQILFNHPIYRVFYVSHDSQDLKIFSYIARDCGTNVFKCNVFKAEKKSVAMLIVRTVGQAFEVCHKFTKDENQTKEDHEDSQERNQQPSGGIKKKGGIGEGGGDGEEDERDKMRDSGLSGYSISDSFVHIPYIPDGNNSNLMALDSNSLEEKEDSGSFSKTPSPEDFDVLDEPDTDPLKCNGMTVGPQIFLLKQHLRRKNHEIQMARGQITFLKDQMRAEANARMESEVKVTQLLQQNAQLLKQIQQMIQRLKETEIKGGSPRHASCDKNGVKSCPKHSPHRTALQQQAIPLTLETLFSASKQKRCSASANIYTRPSMLPSCGTPNRIQKMSPQKCSNTSATTGAILNNCSPQHDKQPKFFLNQTSSFITTIPNGGLSNQNFVIEPNISQNPYLFLTSLTSDDKNWNCLAAPDTNSENPRAIDFKNFGGIDVDGSADRKAVRRITTSGDTVSSQQNDANSKLVNFFEGLGSNNNTHVTKDGLVYSYPTARVESRAQYS